MRRRRMKTNAEASKGPDSVTMAMGAVPTGVNEPLERGGWSQSSWGTVGNIGFCLWLRWDDIDILPYREEN